MLVISELIFLTNIIIINFKKDIKELIITFFIINSILSSRIILIIIIENILIINKINIIKITILIILWIKIGIFPFNWWIIIIGKINRWTNLFKINFVLKIPSIIIIIIINFIETKLILLIIIIPIISINLTNLKKIFIIISIINIYWFIIIIKNNYTLIVIAIRIYITTNLFIYKTMEWNKTNFLNQINSLNKKVKVFLIVTVINLINIPPLNIFVRKWIIIKSIERSYIIIAILILSNALILVNYFKLILTSIREHNIKSKSNYKKKISLNNIINFTILNIIIL